MPRLSRMRLVCVGHPQARMNDVILSFCDKAGQTTNSTIWLRNGGGKSSLVALFLSLVQPGKNRFLGKQAETPRRVEDYVDAKDRAVVVCEWELDEPQGTFALNGSRRHLLTGVFYEWKQQTATERDELDHLFFAAEVHPGEPKLTLEGLPLFVAHDGRKARRKLANFKQEWLSLRDQYPGHSVIAEEVYQRWMQFLDAAHIDPGLFKFQVQMNRREGAADEIFRFAEHDDFVDFLLEVAADPSFAEKCSDVLKQYQKDLRERKERLLPEQELLNGLLSRLEPMKHIATERLRLRGEVSQLAISYNRLAAFLGERLSFHRNEATRLNGLAEAQASAATTAKQQAAEHQKSVVRARLIAAKLRLKQAQAHEQSCRDHHERSLSVFRLTQAAIPLRNALREERDAGHYRDELDKQRGEHAPLLQELRAAADRCAGRLRGAAEDWRRRLREALTADQLARREAIRLRSEASRLAADASTARSRSEATSQQLAVLQSERTQLVESGLLEPSESGASALKRLSISLANLRNDQSRCESAIRTASDLLRQWQTELSEANLAITTATVNLTHLQSQLDAALKERRRLEAECLLRALLEVEDIDLERVSDEPLQALARESCSVEERLVASRLRHAEEERAVHFLESKGLLPAAPEVEHLLGVLNPRFPQLWTGWAWIEKNRPHGAARRDALQHFPHLATGLVVRDQDYDAVCQAVRELHQQFSVPIVIAPQRSLDGSNPTDWTVFGPTSDAYFDQQAAITEKERLKDHLEELGAEIRAAVNHRYDVDDLASRLRQFRERFPQGWFTAQNDAIAVEQDRLESLRDQVHNLTEQLEKTGVRQAELQSEQEGYRSQITSCEQAIQRIEDFVRQWESHESDWRREQDEMLAKAELLDGQQAASVRDAVAQDQLADKHARDTRSAGEEAARYESALKDMRHTSDQFPTETTSSLDEVRARYEQLKSQYESNVDEGGLRRLAIEAEGRAKRERAKLAAELRRREEPSSGYISEADVSARLDEIPDWELLEEELATAKERHFADMGRLSSASEDQKRHEARLKEIESQWNVLAPGVLISTEDAASRTDDEWESLANEQAALAEETDRQSEDHRRHADRLGGESQQHLHRLETLELRRQMLQRIEAEFEDWLSSSASTQASTGDDNADSTLTEDELPERLNGLEDELRRFREQQSGLDKQRSDAAVQIRKWINEDRFQALRTAYVPRFQTLADEEWETAAADWMRELTLRSETIAGKLAEFDQHRTLIVDELSHVVEDGLDLLRSAGTRSRMPEHVPRFGGSQILKISHKAPPDPGERRDRLGALVDQLVSRDELPHGMELFQTAVRHVAHPIRVQLRNPDPQAKEPYLEVTRLSVLSGGERITCAILMYCTLAQLRGRSRRRETRRPSSVLILDNPIGTANRTSFLELQRDVALAMDIQLLYTTGVNDWEAVRILPNVIRLRNDRLDRRSGQRMLELDSDEPTLEAVHIVRPVEGDDEKQPPVLDEIGPPLRESITR